MADLSNDPTPAEAMAAQQPKKKSKKRNFVPLDDYMPAATRTTSWADEEVILPTAPSRKVEEPKSDIGGFYANQASTRQRSQQSRRDVKVPDNPPFTAYVGNLPFNTEEKDLAHFFQGLKIVSSRFPRDKDNDRPKGFGYIEFESKKDLEKALTFHDKELRERRLRIDLADQTEDKTTGDWRSGGRKPTGDRDRRSGPGRENSGDDVDDWRTAPRKKPEGRRDNRDNRDRRDNRDNRDRRNNFDDGGDSWRDRKVGDEFRSAAFKRREDRDQGGDRDGKFGPRRGNQGGERESSSSSSEPRERKKLNLKPRSADPKEVSHDLDTTYTTKAKVNPFGAAKPRDEEAALKKIEEERKKRQEETNKSEEKANKSEEEEKKN